MHKWDQKPRTDKYKNFIKINIIISIDSTQVLVLISNLTQPLSVILE